MTAPYLEHQNITVPDLNATLDTLLALFPQWQLRSRRRDYIQPSFGDPPFELDWAHLGTDQSYLALQGTPDGSAFIRNPQPYFNHLGIVVTDLDDCLARAIALGLNAKAATPHPARKRAYVQVTEGLSLELIQYVDDDPAQRPCYC